MKRIMVLLLCLAGSRFSFAQELRLAIPIAGERDKNWIIVNHVDHNDAIGPYRDYSCGTQAYDGHDGTDFVLKSFRSMDSGVAVLAAADGTVITVVDSLPDRNKKSVVDRGFGNYIEIRHGKAIAYYAHNRRSSAKVRVGDTVRTGQEIALVGSSGNSSDPHLHFEVWQRVDPFAGSCNTVSVAWREQPNYATQYRLFDADVTNLPPVLDTIRERPPRVSVSQTDTVVTFWSLQGGIVSTDQIEVEWFTPDGTSWFTYTANAGITSEYVYWWSFINPPQESGLWSVVQRVNGAEVCRIPFRVVGTSGVTAPSNANPNVTISNGIVRWSETIRHVQAFTLLGKLVYNSDLDGTRINVRGPLIIQATDFQGNVFSFLTYSSPSS